MASVRRRLDHAVARLPEVRAHIRAVVEQVADAARQRAAAHSRTGRYAASFQVVRGRVDARVESTDPDAVSKEFGHTDPDTGRGVAGIHALGGAASDVAAH